MKRNEKYSAVIVYCPEKLLHIHDRNLSFDDFKKIFRKFIDSENISNIKYPYLYTEMGRRISPLVKDVIVLDKIEWDEGINILNSLTIYYVKNDEKIESYLKEKFLNNSIDFYNKINVKVIDISDNNEIILDVPDWLENGFDASKDIDDRVRFYEQNIYEINKDFFLYAEHNELEEIKNIVHLKKPFFVIGERGSGKTAIIQNAVKAFLKIPDDKFVPVACGTLHPDRAQSDLFGHTKDAYTGAIENTKGYVGKADGGCLYLDEVQDLSKEIQRILIKGIEEHKFYQLGSDAPYESNFLLVCSSNKPLSKLRKYMYEDFYDRISTFQIKIPSIEERKKEKDFISRCLPVVWENYRKTCSNPNLFFEY